MTDPTPTADATPDGAEPAKAPTDWEAEAKKWEKRAKDNHARLKDAEPKLAEWQQLRDASKSAEDRAAEEVARLREETAHWRARAVLSRVEALAAADFTDPTDALNALDPDDYLSAEGEIDEKSLRADLADLLERKPHWRRAGAGDPAPVVPSFDGGARTPHTPNSTASQFAKAVGNLLH
jgi:hypothetical protein